MKQKVASVIIQSFIIVNDTKETENLSKNNILYTYSCWEILETQNIYSFETIHADSMLPSTPGNLNKLPKHFRA